MASQIIFFDKNKIDISNQNATITASEGQSFTDFMRNRNNTSAWVTTDSVDADLTEIVFDFGERRTVDNILIVKHNLKGYTLKYWDGALWQDFADPIAPSALVPTNLDSDDTTTWHQVTQVETSKLQLIISGTQTPNIDKYISQFIATTLMGQFEGWPSINNSEHDRARTKIQALSGKTAINENVGGFKCQLRVPHWRVLNDIQIVQEMYEKNEGFLVWLCGGDQGQFWFAAKGYRLEDIYLMKCVNEYSPDYVKGSYLQGFDHKINLEETID